jgi:SAM-dependent methyltransferase
MICRVCDSTDLEPVIDLGRQPWCNNFLRPDQVGLEPYYPLRVLFCQGCHTAQLDYTVPKETMFGDHTYLSGITSSLSKHFRSVAEYADRTFFAGTRKKAAFDIGSNDGTQLKHFKALGYDVLGVEASRGTARIANDAGIPTLNRFFNLDAAREIDKKFQIVNAAGVFFHLEELHSVTEGIRELLADDGVFIVQFLYMKCILDNNAFDQIYHEHLLYYNLETIEHLLRRHGLSMFDAYLSPIHGGSIVGFVTHADRFAASERLTRMRRAEAEGAVNSIETYKSFQERVAALKSANVDWLTERSRQGKKIFGMGAPVKGNTLLNYFGVTTDFISCLVEKNALRRGLVAPGSHIPVVIEDEVERPPDVYYVLAWNFKREILERHRNDIESGVEFYFPIDPAIQPE